MSPHHILIVDDHEINIRILNTIFANQGYKVSYAEKGEKALQLIQSDPPTLILLDVCMPEMDGYEVCRELKQKDETKDIPVIFITSLTGLNDKLEAFSVGGVDYIIKPFDVGEVLVRVETQLKIRELQQQLIKKTELLELQNVILQNRVCDETGFDQSLYLELTVALEQSQLELQYQPIVDFSGGELLGFEALLRWIHPQIGLIPPDKFIPIAEQTGLIIRIGEWVAEQVLQQIQAWNRYGINTDLYVSINVSVNQLIDRSFVEFVEQCLILFNVPPRQLKLEMTEGVLVRDFDTTIENLHYFKELGIDLYIDDFGTGYSTLSRLIDFPFDVLKVDRSFLHKDKWLIVKSIVSLAIALDKDVIVEGIETIEQLTKLKKLGCYKGQGYYFSRPVTTSKATEMVELGLIELEHKLDKSHS